MFNTGYSKIGTLNRKTAPGTIKNRGLQHACHWKVAFRPEFEQKLWFFIGLF